MTAADLAAIDSDGDGVDDVRDQCPRDAEDHDGVFDDDGCPEADQADRPGSILTPVQAEQHPPRRF
ncbi:MAG: hypothetical protein HY905_07145 [Deltaproteobacteria bacterium]|nr:hypothetical protein [Deltaproteobacteria bacterium]